MNKKARDEPLISGHFLTGNVGVDAVGEKAGRGSDGFRGLRARGQALLGQVKVISVFPTASVNKNLTLFGMFVVKVFGEKSIARPLFLGQVTDLGVLYIDPLDIYS